MDINADTRDRIIAAANRLFDESGREFFPTVDAVRRAARVGMNDASAVMKQWRRMQTARAAPAAASIPDRLKRIHEEAAAAIWADAQEIANEALVAAQQAWEAERTEADALREELSQAFESQTAELAEAQGRAADFEHALADKTRQVAELTDQMSSAMGRLQSAEARADEMRSELRRAHAEIERLHAALADAQACRVAAEVRSGDCAERLAKAEAERDQARDEAAELRGRIAVMRREGDSPVTLKKGRQKDQPEGER